MNVNGFEKELVEYVGVSYVVVLFFGIVVIYLVLKVVGVGKDDIVIC